MSNKDSKVIEDASSHIQEHIFGIAGIKTIFNMFDIMRMKLKPFSDKLGSYVKDILEGVYDDINILHSLNVEITDRFELKIFIFLNHTHFTGSLVQSIRDIIKEYMSPNEESFYQYKDQTLVIYYKGSQISDFVKNFINTTIKRVIDLKNPNPDNITGYEWKEAKKYYLEKFSLKLNLKGILS